MTTERILVFSLNPAVDKLYYIDNFIVGKLYRSNRAISSAGGKGTNVARVLAMLGHKPILAGFFGGATGHYIIDNCIQNGIECLVSEVDRETRTNINIIDNLNIRETEILETGSFITKENIEKLYDNLDSITDNISIIVLSGSLPEGAEIDLYSDIIQICKKKWDKASIIVDTSGNALELSLQQGINIIKPNLKEFMYLTKNNFEINDINGIGLAATEVSKMYGCKVFVSLGNYGCIGALEDKALYLKPSEITYVNSIGSGDSMVAGLAFTEICNKSLIDTLCFVSACGMSNAESLYPGDIDLANIKKYDQILSDRIIDILL